MELKFIRKDRAWIEANTTPKSARSGSQKGVYKMKIGAFFIVLLVALVALGYLLSDSLHLREVVSSLQKENAHLVQALQQTEQAKQEALITLQTATQELNVCQQKVEQSNQTITRLIDDNAYLKKQNELLASQQTANTSSASPQPETKTFQATTFSLFTFLMLGAGSIVAIGLRSFQKHTRHGAKTGQYVYLTNAEIKDLIQRRRESKQSNTPLSSY
jgi:hypothetical protein